MNEPGNRSSAPAHLQLVATSSQGSSAHSPAVASHFLQGQGQSPCDGLQHPGASGLSDLSSSPPMLALLQGQHSLSWGPSHFPRSGALPPAPSPHPHSHTLILSPVSSLGFNVTLKAEVHPVYLTYHEWPPPCPTCSFPSTQTNLARSRCSINIG